MADRIDKCPLCDQDILWVTGNDGKSTPVDVEKVRIAMLRDTPEGLPKIEDAVSGHRSHILTCSRS